MDGRHLRNVPQMTALFVACAKQTGIIWAKRQKMSQWTRIKPQKIGIITY